MGFLVAGIGSVMKWGMVDARSFAERLEAVRKSARLGLAIQGLRRVICLIQSSLHCIYEKIDGRYGVRSGCCRSRQCEWSACRFPERPFGSREWNVIRHRMGLLVTNVSRSRSGR